MSLPLHFRTQALGGGHLVGDQLPPRGTLGVAAYDLIGAVYAQVAEAEPFYEGTERISQLGIFSASWPGREGGKSGEGAVQIAEESHYDAAVIDGLDALESFPLLILPDSTVVTPALAERLAAYYQNGGKLILSHRAGFDPDGHGHSICFRLKNDLRANSRPRDDFRPASIPRYGQGQRPGFRDHGTISSYR